MHSQDKIDEYVMKVCRQIRWKRAHPRISSEMTNHITDSRDVYILQGLEETAATDAAISDTGDAEEIGIALDRVHKPKPQWVMLITTTLLLVLGIIIRLLLFSDSDKLEPLHIRLIYTVVGFAGMIGAYYADYTILSKMPKKIWLGIIGIFIVVLFIPIPGLTYDIWITNVVLLYPLVLGIIMYSYKGKGYRGALICALSYLVVAFHLTYTISMFLSTTVCYLVLFSLATYKNWFDMKKHFALMFMIIPPAILVILMFVLQSTIILEQVSVAVTPFNSNYGVIDYIAVLTRDLLGEARFVGAGAVSLDNAQVDIPQIGSIIGHDIDAQFYSDLLLTALIAKYGWVTLLIIISITSCFLIKGFRSSIKQSSSLGQFVSLAVMIGFSQQVIGYVVYNLGFQLGVHVMPMPLVSHGNIAMVVNLVLIGFILSVFRTGDVAAIKLSKP